MEQFKVKYEIKEVVIDYETWKKFCEFSSKGAEKILRKLRLFGTSSATLIVVSIVIRFLIKPLAKMMDSLESSLPKNVWILVLVVLFIGIYYVQSMLAERSLKQAYDEDPSIWRAQSYVLGDSGFRIICSLGDSFYPWKEVITLKKTDDFLVLYLSKTRACVIPKKYLKEKTFIFEYIKERYASSKT